MTATATEIGSSFACYGGTCTVHAPDITFVAGTRLTLLDWHRRFTRFDSESELSQLNADPRETVPVSPMMARLASAVLVAAALTEGLVDATLLDELEAAGYDRDLPTSVPLATALAAAPERRPARPHPRERWRELQVGADAIRRPRGLRLDPGGLAKGVFADVVAERLTAAGARSFAIDCAGDLRVGPRTRAVRVAGPFDGEILHTFALANAGVATSGIGRRSWLGADGAPAHHLLDPATGRPAFTGVVQATAVAPTALEAEARAKAAVLSGPEGARSWLPQGGVVVYDDGTFDVHETIA